MTERERLSSREVLSVFRFVVPFDSWIFTLFRTLNQHPIASRLGYTVPLAAWGIRGFDDRLFTEIGIITSWTRGSPRGCG